jgi:hypothetical protein
MGGREMYRSLSGKLANVVIDVRMGLELIFLEMRSGWLDLFGSVANSVACANVNFLVSKIRGSY